MGRELMRAGSRGAAFAQLKRLARRPGPAVARAPFPAFCDWYEITARERQIIGYLQTGAAPKQIARLLGLSVHTVKPAPARGLPQDR